jgi:hypothetical protein
MVSYVLQICLTPCPYSLESPLIGINSVLPSRSTFKLRVRILSYAELAFGCGVLGLYKASLTYLTLSCNPAYLTRSPEPITFFGVKSQNKNCFSGLAPNPDLAVTVSIPRLGNSRCQKISLCLVGCQQELYPSYK